MKKTILILFSLAALALAGCTKVENFSSRENTGNEIGFATYTGRALTKSGTALGQSFNVEGFLSGTPSTRYFFSTSYRYANNRYTGDTTRYWPSSGVSLDFNAVSPLQYKDTLGKDVDIKPVDSTITVAGIDGRTDIVAARLVNQSFIDPVTLNFGHKLTKVSFKAVGFDATKNYKISGITVIANSSADYKFGATESWEGASDKHSYAFLGEDKAIPSATVSPVAVGDTLFLIPSQTATIKAKVSYSIYDGTFLIDTTETPVEINLPVTGVWGINKSVVYKLTLNISSSRNPINFSATVEDWDADTTVIPPVYYVENGVDYGPGIEVSGVVWAPVNCGYDATDYPYGKLYQWGRKDGQGCGGTVEPDPVFPTTESGTIVDTQISDLADLDPMTFYKRSSDPKNWYIGSNPAADSLWNDEMKTVYDPCPDGWRIPIFDDIKTLFNVARIWTDTGGPDGRAGAYFGTAPNQVFFPATGRRLPDGTGASHGQYSLYWSSTAKAGEDKARCLVAWSGHIYMDNYARAYGFAVRCVAE